MRSRLEIDNGEVRCTVRPTGSDRRFQISRWIPALGGNFELDSAYRGLLGGLLRLLSISKPPIRCGDYLSHDRLDR